MKYRVIHSTQLMELERLVEERLNDGWTCVGGIFVVYSSFVEYFQAMTKTESKEYNSEPPMTKQMPFKIEIPELPMKINEIRLVSV